MYIARKTNFFYKVVANIMQYKYQEVFCNFLPTLGTECLCGMVKPTAFGPCMHCKNYTFIIILRDATMLSLFFSQIHRSFPTWPALWAAELQAGHKEKASQAVTPSLQLPVSWCSHSSKSWGYSVDLCAGTGKTSHDLQTTQMKTLNRNYSAVWHCHPWVTGEEKLYEYRHNNTDNIHNYSMIIQALPFYIMKQSLRLTLLLSPWYLSGIPEKQLLSFVIIDNQSF